MTETDKKKGPITVETLAEVIVGPPHKFTYVHTHATVRPPLPLVKMYCERDGHETGLAPIFWTGLLCHLSIAQVLADKTAVKEAIRQLQDRSRRKADSP